MRTASIAAIAAALICGGCAIDGLGADYAVYDGGGIVMVERGASGAGLQTAYGLDFTLGATVTRVGVSRTAFAEECARRPACAFGRLDALFVHRDATGLDLQLGGPVQGLTLGRSSTFFTPATQSTVDNLFMVNYDSSHPDGVRGCLGWESCGLPRP